MTNNNSEWSFVCEFCGYNFGNEPEKLAAHIGQNHDARPSDPKKQKIVISEFKKLAQKK